MGYAIVGVHAMFMTSNTHQHSQENWSITGNAWNESTAAMSEWRTKTVCSTYGSYNPIELGWQKTSVASHSCKIFAHPLGCTDVCWMSWTWHILQRDKEQHKERWKEQVSRNTRTWFATAIICSTYGSYNPIELGWRKCVMPAWSVKRKGSSKCECGNDLHWKVTSCQNLEKLLIFQCFSMTYDSITDRVIAGGWPSLCTLVLMDFSMWLLLIRLTWLQQYVMISTDKIFCAAIAFLFLGIAFRINANSAAQLLMLWPPLFCSPLWSFLVSFDLLKPTRVYVASGNTISHILFYDQSIELFFLNTYPLAYLLFASTFASMCFQYSSSWCFHQSAFRISSDVNFPTGSEHCILLLMPFKDASRIERMELEIVDTAVLSHYYVWNVCFSIIWGNCLSFTGYIHCFWYFLLAW